MASSKRSMEDGSGCESKRILCVAKSIDLCVNIVLLGSGADFEIILLLGVYLFRCQERCVNISEDSIMKGASR